MLTANSHFKSSLINTRRRVAFTWDALEVFAVLVRDEWVDFLKVRFCRFILFECGSVGL